MPDAHTLPTPTLTTPRLILTELHAQHAGVAVAGFAQSAAVWSAYLASAASGDTPQQQFQKRLERSIAGWADGSRFSFIALDRVTGGYVGDCNVGDIIRGNTWEANIGWRVAAAAQGKGLAHEMVKAACDWAFSPAGAHPSGPNLHRLCAAIMPGNDRSIRLAERLGFAFEGTKRSLIRLNGTWRDHHIYGLVNHDWQPA